MNDARRAWLELRLLCRRGVRLSSIAPELSRLIRRIVPADACAICWLDDDGMPTGFFHENSLPELKELFANEYEAMFAGPGEFGVAWMLGQRGRTIGNWLGADDRQVEMSNTYNLWMRPLGHRHLIEARVEVDGRPRALLTLYREPRWPFTEDDVAALRMVEPLLQRAETPDDSIAWNSERSGEEYLLVDGEGARLLSQSGGAGALLREAHLIGQEVSLVAALTSPPKFARDLSQEVRTGRGDSVRLPAGMGSLHVTARRLTAPTSGPWPAEQLLLNLVLERPRSVSVIHNIMELGLSPLRSELLLYAATGGRRADSTRLFGISKEALKKHLAEVYRATGARDWTELAKAVTADA